MKFAQNGLYIESYRKCPNCGNLMYEDINGDSAKPVVHDNALYCSQRCVDWKLDRDRRRGAPGV